MSWQLRFLGVGNASAVELGNSSAVIERDNKSELMIDCGPEALTAYLAHYGHPPDAVFITHAHMDHVAGFERLFVKSYFDSERRGKTRIYVPTGVMPHLQARVAQYPNVLAEGGANFWDAFQLIVVDEGFWHNGVWYQIFPVRHHRQGSAFALKLARSLVWTGDTRPIPELLEEHADQGELIAHDCALHGNPSHSGIDDLEREYAKTLLARCVLYHYASAAEAQALEARGHRVARAGMLIELADPTGS